MPEPAIGSALVYQLASIKSRATVLQMSNVPPNNATTAKQVAQDTLILLEAIEHVLNTRDDLEQSASLFVQSAARWEDECAENKMILCLGQSLAYQASAGHIDQALIAAFTLRTPHQSDHTAEHQGTSPDQDVPR